VSKWTVVYVSADGQRSIDDGLEAPTAAAAAQKAQGELEGPMFGRGSAWEVAGVWRDKHVQVIALHMADEL
jgi:hypothetical protein